MNKKEYTYIELLGSEESRLNKFMEYDDGYICDIISEIADGSVSIFTSDLWAHAPKIQGYLEEAVAHGLVNTDDFSFEQAFRAGEYLYYTHLLYDNLDSLVYNWAIDYIKHKNIRNVDFNELEYALCKFDHNNEFDYIVDCIHDSVNPNLAGYYYCTYCKTILGDDDEFECCECEKAGKLEKIGHVAISNTIVVYVYEIVYDMDDFVIAGYLDEKPGKYPIYDEIFRIGEIKMNINELIKN